MNKDTKVWIATCPRCGVVRIEQITKPTSCKTPLRIGWSTRQCREVLTDVRSTRGK